MSRDERLSPRVSSWTAWRVRAGSVKPNAASRVSASPGGSVALVLSAALVLLFGAWVARQVAAPVRRTSAAAAQVASGHLDVRVEERGAGEVGGLVSAFNSMTRALEHNQEELLEQNQLLREIRMTATLDHPHIVPVYAVGEHAGHLHLSMKLYEGGSLAGQLPRFVAEPRAAAPLVECIARAVHHAHQHRSF